MMGIGTLVAIWVVANLPNSRSLRRDMVSFEEKPPQTPAWGKEMSDVYSTDGFDYLRKLDGHGLVLDIGAGTTRGISQLEKSSLGSGLSFEAVALSYSPLIKENLGLEKTHITSAESLKGVKNESVAGVISLFGISYCTRPDLAVYSIDRVLLPGGVIKAGFISSEKTAYSQSGSEKEESAELLSIA